MRCEALAVLNPWQWGWVPGLVFSLSRLVAEGSSARLQGLVGAAMVGLGFES